MNYQVEAAVTESPQFHGQLLRLKQFEGDLAGAIYALKRLDPIKKLLFYGKKEKNFRDPIGIDCVILPDMLNAKQGEKLIDRYTAIRIIHGIIGVATEACEMLELLSKSVIEHEKFDAVNLMEESGDVFWYLACLSNATGISFEEVQRINIEKLRKRYPNKFTEFDAINRNTEAERAVLEQKPTEADKLKAYDQMHAEPIAAEECAAEMLQRLGTDGYTWAQEFVKRVQMVAITEHMLEAERADVLDTLRAWFANDIEAGKQSQHSENEVLQFIGWLSADIAELNKIEVPLLAESWERFKKRYALEKKAEDKLEKFCDAIDKVADGKPLTG